MRSDLRARPGVRPRFIAGAITRTVVPCGRTVDRCHDLDPRTPGAVRLDRRAEHDLLLTQLGIAIVWPDPSLSDVAATLVAEHEHVVVHSCERLPRPVDRRVLHLEQICEIGSYVNLDLGLHGLGPVVHDGQFLEETIAYHPPADHGHGRVRVLRAGSGDEEEASGERLRLVRRERVERLPVRRLPQAAQRDGARRATRPLPAPIRTISHAATAADAAGATCCSERYIMLRSHRTRTD